MCLLEALQGRTSSVILSVMDAWLDWNLFLTQFSSGDALELNTNIFFLLLATALIIFIIVVSNQYIKS